MRVDETFLTTVGHVVFSYLSSDTKTPGLTSRMSTMSDECETNLHAPHIDRTAISLLSAIIIDLAYIF